MPQPTLPPLTAKQAKRRYQQSGKKFQFTASQFRAAERREELEDRRRKVEAKEERRKANKRKREEKGDKERAAKRQQLEQGRIRPEDTWGKVHASQHRLNTFFKRPAPAAGTPAQGAEESTEDEESGYDSREDSFVDTLAQGASASEQISEEELVSFFSTGLSQPLSDLSPQRNKLQEPKSMDSEPDQRLAPLMSTTAPSEQPLLDAQLSFSDSIWDFDIAEDATAESAPGPRKTRHYSQVTTTPKKAGQLSATGLDLRPSTPSPLKRKADTLNDASMTSPSKSVRSALSEMSRSDVNIRSQEKPDTTSRPKSGTYLPSPDRRSSVAPETPADVLALISTQDLEDDNEIFSDKENTDPWHVSTNAADKPTPVAAEPRVSATSESQPFEWVPPMEQDDLAELEHLVDFETEFDDEDLDDATLAGLSTQMPAKNTSVSSWGSPKKVKSQRLAHAKLRTASQIRGKQSLSMAPPPSRKSHSSGQRPAFTSRSFTKASSFSFDDVDDDDLTHLADELEAAGNQTFGRGVIPKKSRILPWLHPSQFPPPTQSGEDLLGSTRQDDEEI